VGVFTAKSPYIGKKNDTVAIPLLSYENQYLRFFANTLDFKLPSVGNFEFALRGRLPFGGSYKASDSVYLAGMADRKASFDVGAAATWDTSLGKASFEYLYDVSGHSKGSKFKVGFEHSYIFDRRFEVVPHVEFTHQDAKSVDYYFGVKAIEATSVRPEYIGKATNNTEIGVRFAYAIDPRQRLLFDVVNTRFGDSITDSPLVSRKSIPSLKAGYIYRF
jgi:outer membrane scaffolding protein for murein synthesis (MipA/OmpV family)